MKILVINAGSSSLKYQLIDMEGETVAAKGQVERIGIEGTHFKQQVGGNVIEYSRNMKDHVEAIEAVMSALTDPEKGAIRSMDHDAERVSYTAGTIYSGSANCKTEDEIRAIALAKVPGATDSDITLYLDEDDGRLQYEGRIIYQNMKYEFEIDAYSGAIRDWDAESVFDD